MSNSKITKMISLKDAQWILDIDSGDLDIVYAQLKEEMLAIKLKGINSAAKEVELSRDVKFITAQLKICWHKYAEYAI